jgi:NADPH-dependent 2,4-dienoyl-CoA reductase/sulfur reductase-like enzyme/ferredoxin
MRVTLPGAERRGPSFGLTFDGEKVEAWPGESIAAALTSAGKRALREAPTGAPRGMWCGMGVCGECRVEVDGQVRLACMTPATPNQAIRHAPARIVAGENTTASALGMATVETPDVLIVGAGPSGLSAARIAASAGLDVLIADERAMAGGQYFKQPANAFTVDPKRVDRQTAEGRTLIAQAAASGVRILHGRMMWAATRDDDRALSVYLSGDDGAVVVRPKRLVLAMGAYERPWPIPGWTLPGVMTAGAAQTLLRAYSTAPGRRVLVAGNGPLNIQVARELLRAGCEVVALVEAAPALGPANALDAARMARAAPRLALDGAAMLTALRRARVPMLHGYVVTRIDGEDKARTATVGRLDREGDVVPGSEQTFDVDAVCLGYGFLPQAEAARALGCAMESSADGTIGVVRDDAGRTSIDDVQVIGDGGGLGGARIAMAQGVLAGAALVDAIGGSSVPAAVHAKAKRELARHRTFQDALWRIYTPVGTPKLRPQALLCRCESIPVSAVDALLSAGLRDISAIKRATRAGMGACGGRYCAALIEARLAAADPSHQAPAIAGFAPRAPFKPTTIDQIVVTAQNDRIKNESSSEEH